MSQDVRDAAYNLTCTISPFKNNTYNNELEIWGVSKELLQVLEEGRARFIIDKSKLTIDCSGDIDYIIELAAAPAPTPTPPSPAPEIPGCQSVNQSNNSICQ